MKSSSHKKFSPYQILIVATLTLISRVLGFLRDILFVRALGLQSASGLSDAFLTAFRIPQVIYEILLGGALGSALVPVLAQVHKQEDKQAVDQLMTLMCIVVGIGTTLIAIGISLYAPDIIYYLAPGFSEAQQMRAAVLLSIMSFFIIFAAISLLLAEAARYNRQFIIASFSQILYNITFILGLCWYAFAHASIEFLAWCVVIGGIMQLILNAIQYAVSSYRFVMPHYETLNNVRLVIRRLVPSTFSAGIAEISFFIELQFASYLPSGSISLLSYTSSFMRLPLGIFVYALSTVLFPDMVRLSTYAPQRLNFIVYEAAKVLFWILIPIIILMSCYAYDIFGTLYTHKSFSDATLITLQWLLIVKLISLPFLAISKVCVDTLYALHKVRTPSIIFFCGTLTSIALNIVLMPKYGIYGLACSATIVAFLRTLFFLMVVNNNIKITRYAQSFGSFCLRSCLQMGCILAPLGLCLHVVRTHILPFYIPNSYLFFTTQCGLWLWVAPLCLLAAVIILLTRKSFGLKMYFVDRLMKKA